mgnify:FL=1
MHLVASSIIAKRPAREPNHLANMPRLRLRAVPSIIVILAMMSAEYSAGQEECGDKGLYCENGSACKTETSEVDGSTIYSCDCNTDWKIGPTFTGYTCDVPTVDCGSGIWCHENNGECMMRNMTWAHGDDGKACRDGGGECVSGESTMGKGGADILICRGGSFDNTFCNSARGCRCFRDFYGTHCEQQIVACDTASDGQVTFWCFAPGTTGCASRRSCNCLAGYEGRHCNELAGLSDPDENASSSRGGSKNVVIIPVLAILCACFFSAVLFMYRRERSGKPIFSPLDESLLHGHGGNGQVHPRPEANVQDFLPPSNLENHLHVPSKETEENEIQLERMRI